MKNDTFASTKFLLAALGLAFVKAGQVLVEESNKLDVMDAALPDADNDPGITVADVTSATLDSSGLPWDARINAGTKTQNKDGTWKRLKGCDDAVYDAVIAELRALHPKAATTVATPPAVVAPSVPQVPVVTVPVANDYTKLCDFLAKNTGQGKVLDDAWIESFFTANGASLPALATDQARAAELLALLRKVFADNNIPEVA